MRTSEAQPPADTTVKARRRCRAALWWTIGFYITTSPLRYYEYIIYSYLPSPFYDWGPTILIILTLATEGYTIYLAIRYFRLSLLQGIYPFIVITIAHFILSSTDPYETNIKSYCSIFRDEREYLVKAYCAKTLSLQKTYCDHCFVLPPEWKHLAVADGIVEITCDYDRQTGLFLTVRGLLDAWHGLMYQSDASAPDAPNIADAYEITKIEKNWYYVNH